MPINLPAPNAGAGAPEVEDGLALVKFTDIKLVAHPDWAGVDSFGHDDTGDRYHFQAQLCDPETKKLVYVDGDPVELEAMSRIATGAKSNFAKHLKGILTGAEFALWENNEPFDTEAMQGRLLNAMIVHSKGGWPQIESFLGQPKTKAKAKVVVEEDED